MKFIPGSKFPLICYVLCLCTGKLWYVESNTKSDSKETQFSIDFKPQLDEWGFKEEILSQSILDRLGNGNIKNGFYINDQSGERLSFFLGEWDPNNKRQMSVVTHTPDVCWVGAGWIPVHLGQPNKTLFKLVSESKSKSPIPSSTKEKLYFLETRVFEHALTHQKELAMWFTVIDRRIINEPNLIDFKTTEDHLASRGKTFAALRNSQNSAHRFLTALKERKSWSGKKMFYRVSIPVYEEDWELSYLKIKEWIPLWFKENTEEQLTLVWQ